MCVGVYEAGEDEGEVPEIDVVLGDGAVILTAVYFYDEAGGG